MDNDTIILIFILMGVCLVGISISTFFLGRGTRPKIVEILDAISPSPTEAAVQEAYNQGYIDGSESVRVDHG